MLIAVIDDVCGCNLSTICPWRRLNIRNVPSLYPAIIDRIVVRIFFIGLVVPDESFVGTIELSQDVKQVTF